MLSQAKAKPPLNGAFVQTPLSYAAQLCPVHVKYIYSTSIVCVILRKQYLEANITVINFSLRQRMILRDGASVRLHFLNSIIFLFLVATRCYD